MSAMRALVGVVSSVPLKAPIAESVPTLVDPQKGFVATGVLTNDANFQFVFLHGPLEQAVFVFVFVFCN